MGWSIPPPAQPAAFGTGCCADGTGYCCPSGSCRKPPPVLCWALPLARCGRFCRRGAGRLLCRTCCFPARCCWRARAMPPVQQSGRAAVVHGAGSLCSRPLHRRGAGHPVAGAGAGDRRCFAPAWPYFCTVLRCSPCRRRAAAKTARKLRRNAERTAKKIQKRTCQTSGHCCIIQTYQSKRTDAEGLLFRQERKAMTNTGRKKRRKKCSGHHGVPPVFRAAFC